METLKKLIEKLGLTADKADDEAALVTKVEQHFAAQKAEAEKVTGEIEALKAKLDAAEKNAPTEPEVPVDIADMLGEAGESKIDSLIAASKVTPAVAASLKKILVGEAGKRNVRYLSRKHGNGTDSVVGAVVKALMENKPVELNTEHTGHQAYHFAAGGSQEDPEQEEVTKGMTEMANAGRE